MADAAQVALARIPAGEAAARLRGFEATDPRGIADPFEVLRVCEGGECFALTGAIQAVYVLAPVAGMAWVQALQGHAAPGVDLLGAVDSIITKQAEGARAIGLQTRRPGMVRKLKARGYRVTGWIMQKDLKT